MITRTSLPRPSVEVQLRDYFAAGRVAGTTDDAPAVTAALAALPSTGGRLLWPDGDVHIATLVTIGRPVTIQGVNRSVSTLTIAATKLLRAATSNVTFNDITFRGAAGIADGGKFLDNTLTSTNNYTGWRFYRCLFRNASLAFQRVNRVSEGTTQTTGTDIASDVSVVDCEFDTIRAAYGIELGGITGAVVDRCWVHDVGIDTTAGEGVKVLAGSTGVRVTNCLLEDNTRDGIDIYDSVGTLVSGCVIRNNAQLGIDMKWKTTEPNGCKNHRIINNEVYGNTAGGIHGSTSNTLILGNLVRDNGSYGIRVGSSEDQPVSGPTVKTRVVNNICSGNVSHGIYTGNAVTNITIDGNTCFDNSTWGINISSDSVDCDVRNNTCLNNTSGGLSVHGTRTRIAGNRTQDVGDAVVNSAAVGVLTLDRRHGFHIQASRYIIPAGTKSTIAMVSGLEYACPIWIDTPGTVVRIGTEVTVAGTAATVLRLGIRSADTNYRPGAVIGETTVAGDAVASVEATVSWVLPAPGLYFLECVAQNTGGTLPTLRAISSVTLPPISGGSLAGVMGSASHVGYVTASGAVTGALPGTYPLSDRAGVVPVVALRG